MSAPIERLFRAQMQAITEVLEDFLNGDERPKKNGFVVLMFPFDGQMGAERCNYISNASREDVAVLLTEMAAKFRGQPDDLEGRA